jgi:phenylacetate-CoA ligase
MKPEELRRFQEERLRAIVRHAYKYVPFYRRRWKEVGVRPEDVKTVEDLRKLPVITRQDVRNNYQDFIALNYKHFYDSKKFVTTNTSGSSGIPISIIFNPNAWSYLEAVYLRALLAVGYDPKKPLVYYWPKPLKKEIYHLFGVLRKIHIPSQLSEDEQINLLTKISPEYLYYYSSILYSISKKIRWEGMEFNSKAIITHAEVLSKKMEKVISNSFNAPVFDEYGMNEFFRIAWQCKEKTGYHVDCDSVVVEMIKDNESISDGEMGEIIITGLANYLFPLIRYNTEDIGVAMNELCSCRRSLPLMIKSIEGRSTNIVRLKSGRVFAEKSLIESVAGIPEIYKFRIEYYGKNRFKIYLVVFKNSKGMFEKILKNFEKVVKEPVKVDIEIIDEIPISKGGKRAMIKVVDSTSGEV